MAGKRSIRWNGTGAAEAERGRKGTDCSRYALEKHEITDLSDVIMVGDRKYDVTGAKKCGLVSMGVLYGFGSREELLAAGADHIAETVEEMSQLLVSL